MDEKILFSEIEHECTKIITSATNNFLKNKFFNLKDSDFLINHLNDFILDNLKQVSDNFKYILNIVLLKVEDLNIVQDISMYYDIETDGVITKQFKFDNIACIINLFVLAI